MLFLTDAKKTMAVAPPPTAPTFKPSTLVGTWGSEKTKFTVKEDGSITDININNVGFSGKDITISNWDAVKNTAVTVYEPPETTTISGTDDYSLKLKFTSSDSCTATLTKTKDGSSTTHTITKNADTTTSTST